MPICIIDIKKPGGPASAKPGVKASMANDWKAGGGSSKPVCRTVREFWAIEWARTEVKFRARRASPKGKWSASVVSGEHHRVWNGRGRKTLPQTDYVSDRCSGIGFPCGISILALGWYSIAGILKRLVFDIIMSTYHRGYETLAQALVHFVVY